MSLLLFDELIARQSLHFPFINTGNHDSASLFLCFLFLAAPVYSLFPCLLACVCVLRAVPLPRPRFVYFSTRLNTKIVSNVALAANSLVPRAIMLARAYMCTSESFSRFDGSLLNDLYAVYEPTRLVWRSNYLLVNRASSRCIAESSHRLPLSLSIVSFLHLHTCRTTRSFLNLEVLFF